MGAKLSIYYERGTDKGAPYLYYDMTTKIVTLSFFAPDCEGGGNWFSVELPDAMCNALADYVTRAKANATEIPPCPPEPRKLRMKTTEKRAFEVGDTVIVNDRDRLAVPHWAKIVSIDDSRGVAVEFLEDTPQVKSWKASRDARESANTAENAAKCSRQSRAHKRAIAANALQGERLTRIGRTFKLSHRGGGGKLPQKPKTESI